MKRIGKSKEPTLKILQNIVFNLKEKFNRSVFLEVQAVAHSETNTKSTQFRLSFVPGFSKSSCSARVLNTWPKVLVYYRKLMKKKVS